MSVYIGPCNYGTPEPANGERFITADSSNEPSKVISVVGDLDMKNKRILNLQDPREDESNDAATVGYVGKLGDFIYNKKVDWQGGTMTGPLSMGMNKLTNLADPEDDEDAVNKQYLNQILFETRPYDLGRFLVFPHTDNTKTYFAIGSKRNIDLDDGKVFEILNGTAHNPQYITSGNLDRTVVPVQGKADVMMRLNSQHIITPNLSKPWTFLFSIKHNHSHPPTPANDFIFNFGGDNVILISLTQNNFIYTIGKQDPVMVEIDTSKLNHFAWEYAGKKLILWVNGISRKTHTDLPPQNFLILNTDVIGVVSIYSRKLSRQEIIEHFVDYHVKAFADDEVYY